MSSYRGMANGPDRTTAIAAVVGVHALLGFIIISGLQVSFVADAVDQLKTFSIREPVPPPPPPPPPPQRESAAKKPEGAPAKKADPTPVVAPKPRIPAPSPVVAAKVAGTGTASTSGAGTSGTGTGAGGSGSGPGGGGTDYSRFTPARLVSNIPSREYGRLAASGMPSGVVGVRIMVGTDGSATSCRIARSSGDGALDNLVCQLTQRYVRFSPARDPNGRPVAQEITYFPTWRRR